MAKLALAAPPQAIVRNLRDTAAGLGLVSCLLACLLAGLAPVASNAQTGARVAAVCQEIVNDNDRVALQFMTIEASVLDQRLQDSDPEIACALQFMLSQRGYDLGVDGDFGPMSRRALANFKAVHCNAPDPSEALDRATISCLIEETKPLGIKPLPLTMAAGGAALPSTPSPPAATSQALQPSSTTSPEANTATGLPDPLQTPLPGSKPSLQAPGGPPAPTATEPAAGNHLQRASQVTGQPCRDPASSSDRDIRGNLAIFAGAPLCYSVVTVDEAGRRWLVQVIENYENVAGPAWLAPHDNEDAAQNGGLWAVRQFGGFLITFETGDQRIFQGQDANRIFATDTRTAATCSKLRAPHPRLTRLIDDYFRMAPRPYLSLHSNDNGYSGNGGQGTISVLRRSSILQGHPAKRGSQLADDEDNLMMTAGTQRFDDNGPALHFTSAMHRQGVHVIYEEVNRAKNDCSFSNYVKLTYPTAAYYTVEVEHRQDARMRELITILLNYIGR